MFDTAESNDTEPYTLHTHIHTHTEEQVEDGDTRGRCADISLWLHTYKVFTRRHALTARRQAHTNA